MEELAHVLSKETTPVSYDLKEHSELPPSLYTEVNKAPLFLEEIGATGIYGQFNMTNLSNETDAFVRDEAKRMGYPDTKDGYLSALEILLEKCQFTGREDAYLKVEKIHGFLKIRQKLISREKEKENILTADPLSLSRKDMEIWIRHNLKPTR